MKTAYQPDARGPLAGLRVIGRADLIDNPDYTTSAARIKNAEKLDAIIMDVMRTRTLEENLAYYESQGVTVGPICDVADLIDHPYIRGRGVLQDFEDPDLDRLPMHQVFPRLSDTPGFIRNPAPKLGQDNAILLKELGYDERAQQTLEGKGIR